MVHSITKQPPGRDELVAALAEKTPWDIVIIGGGATGLGSAVDAAARGYRTLLCEQHDFAKGTSSRSTKLIHGGVRYLRQGNLKLVRHALEERERLLRNARHLVWPRAFVVPAYGWGERAWYGAGLKLYDYLAGSLGMGRSRQLSRSAALQTLPTLNPDGLRGAVQYFDGQFDDARLAICLARTAAAHGATVLNYMAAVELWHEQNRVRGVRFEDRETGATYQVAARAVIAAVGIFADQLRTLDTPAAAPQLAFSQGAHLVLDASFLPGNTALMVPKTTDGRVLFAIPWHQRVVLGTTDQRVTSAAIEPVPRADELQFLCDNAARYLTKAPTPSDALAAFAGIRPLVMRSGVNTAELPRDHLISVSPTGLVSITGGKWTTYRHMAEEAVDRAVRVAGLAARPCVTHNLKLIGAPRVGPTDGQALADDAMHYGTECEAALAITSAAENSQAFIHPRLPYRIGDVIWSVRNEFARTLEDVLARRTRSLLLDVRAAQEAAPQVAALIARLLNRDEIWVHTQLQHFAQVSANYLPPT